jgi:hypothetical protein
MTVVIPLRQLSQMLDFSALKTLNICMNSIANLSVQQLRRVINLKEKIEALENKLNQLAGSTAKPDAEAPKKRRKMSAAARRKIGAAQKARWAKQKGIKPAAKRKISAAGIARIKAAQKARWAKIKAAKPAKKKFTMSAAAKAKISAAAKARWAKIKAGKK